MSDRSCNRRGIGGLYRGLSVSYLGTVEMAPPNSSSKHMYSYVTNWHSVTNETHRTLDISNEALQVYL
jgi:hypothetical protein